MLRYSVAAWVIAALLLVAVLHVHLLPALLAGLLVYELVHMIAPRIRCVATARHRGRDAASIDLRSS